MTSTQIILIIFMLAVSGLLLWFNLRGRVSDDQVRQFLKEGALVLDVRTKQEFQEGHVDGAVHLPLDQVPGSIASVEKNKDRVILCHCLSGGRSAIAAARLKRAGYQKAFNLGSLKRANALVRGQR